MLLWRERVPQRLLERSLLMPSAVAVLWLNTATFSATQPRGGSSSTVRTTEELRFRALEVEAAGPRSPAERAWKSPDDGAEEVPEEGEGDGRGAATRGTLAPLEPPVA
mmetsp:Transcript_69101/g.181057  ORF Transcript_69101/g.181057 Transcript_69101/m.181057 type:complete len:108 (-) Transcript_69101:30-353(-)